MIQYGFSKRQICFSFSSTSLQLDAFSFVFASSWSSFSPFYPLSFYFSSIDSYFSPKFSRNYIKASKLNSQKLRVLSFLTKKLWQPSRKLLTNWKMQYLIVLFGISLILMSSAINLTFPMSKFLVSLANFSRSCSSGNDSFFYFLSKECCTFSIRMNLKGFFFSFLSFSSPNLNLFPSILPKQLESLAQLAAYFGCYHDF